MDWVAPYNSLAYFYYGISTYDQYNQNFAVLNTYIGKYAFSLLNYHLLYYLLLLAHNQQNSIGPNCPFGLRFLLK